MLKMQMGEVLKFIVSIIKCYWSLIDYYTRQKNTEHSSL